MRNSNVLVYPPKRVRYFREVLREHLNHAGMTQSQLGAIWGLKPESARRLLNPHLRRPNNIKPPMIAAVIRELKLDAEDARELYWLAALECGYKIGPLPK